ncbi:MAG: hydroxymethylglutaryl-CoA synthase [Patescibacteria group bacterium]|nr:hydroxymethylglutaryl-CoA synthase [Patescibacteria group bacterium]
MAGIISYGFYIPRSRILVQEIARHHRKNANDIISSLGVFSKTVAARDEDTATLALEAATMALGKGDPTLIDAVYAGSETHPYAVKPTATIVAEWLGIGNEYAAFDTQFACKAATGALIAAFGQVKSGDIKQALIIGADKATGKPGDALEYTAASAAVALIIGNQDTILDLEGSYSFTSDTPDFWRRHGVKYPSHGGRFTGKPAYFTHVAGAVNGLLAKLGRKPDDFDHVAFHSPNGRFPREAATALNFSQAQLENSLVVTELGNSYAACSLMALTAVLDVAEPGQRILLVSYGSGAGSDAFSFTVTGRLPAMRHNLRKKMKNYEIIDYGTYLRQLHLIV